MKKLILLLLFIPLVSCSQKWTPEIKVNFMRSCMVNYLEASEKTGKKATNQQARCYCIYALEKSIELYPDPRESDKNMTAENLKKIANAGISGLKNVKDLNTCEIKTKNPINENINLEQNELIPNYKNSRSQSVMKFGNWFAKKNYPLEKFGDINDPFKIREYELSYEIKKNIAVSFAKPLSDKGSKNLHLAITKEYYVNNKSEYAISFFENGVYNSIAIGGFDEMPKEIDFAESYVRQGKIQAIFEYIIDDKYSGNLTGTVYGWTTTPQIFNENNLGPTWGKYGRYEREYDKNKQALTPIVDPNHNSGDGELIWKDIPDLIQIFDYAISRKKEDHIKFLENQEKIYEFVQKIKSGKKLFLRFKKFQQKFELRPNGIPYKDPSIDELIKKIKIPLFTYEFDLKGSSKAISY